MLYEEVSLLVSHMNLFSYRLENVFREKKTKKISQKLAYCAEYHSHIISMALQVDELHRKVTGHMALVWALSMGCIANQLLSMSEAIAEKLYSTPWYLGSIEEQKIVMFMIMRAQIPLTLSAQPFGNYEYALFVTVSTCKC
nr:unnamed protein product [Callosobruchus chinensis]